MAVKLHRCSIQWMKIKSHPCWKVEKALIDTGVEYERVPGPVRRSKRDLVAAGTGQNLYPAIQFEDGSWYREQSKEMERTIRDGHLMERAAGAAPAAAEAQPEVAEPEAAAPETQAEEAGAETPEVH
jgi:hypothetical protein